MEEKKIFGYLVEFDTPGAVSLAAEKVREAGFIHWDVYSPFPIHGIDRKMGVRRTVLPWIVMGAGVIGLFVAFAMQYGLNGIAYPIVVSGKPLMSLPAFIPIMFELTVLFSALAAVFTLMIFNGFPQLYHPLFKSERFRRASDDRFYIVIEAQDEKFHEIKTKEFLSTLGSGVIERVED